MSLTAAVAVATSLAVAIAFYTGRRRDAKGSFPPGPPPKFLIGNALDFNPLHAWDTFIEWKATYGEYLLPLRTTVKWTNRFGTFVGELFGLSVLGTKILVLNSQRVMTDLVDRRGVTYADRPAYVGVGELMGLNRVCQVALHTV